MTLLCGLTTGISAKKALDHSSFDDWKKVFNHSLSNDGTWAAYSINPQEGDGVLTLRNTKTGKEIIFHRGAEPTFSADSRYAVAKIIPPFQATRQAKIDKKKDFDLPQDSLAIVDLKQGVISKFPCVKSYKMGEKGGNWIAYESCDTALTKDINLKDKKASLPLVVRPLGGGEEKILPFIGSYVWSEDGSRLAAVRTPLEKDTVYIPSVLLVSLDGTPDLTIASGAKHYGEPAFSISADRMAFIASNDSNDTGTRRGQLWISDLDDDPTKPMEIDVEFPALRRGPNMQRPHSSDPELQQKLMEEWSRKMQEGEMPALYLNQYSKPQFSHNGKRLIVGVAPKIAPDDTTLVSFERPTLDIWRWDAPFTPPQEKNRLEKAREKTYPVVIDLQNPANQQLLTRDPLVSIAAPDRWDGDWALLRDPGEAIVSQQWDYYAPEKLSIVNTTTGELRNISEVYSDTSELSPEGKFVYWFKDGNWFAYSIKSGMIINMTAELPYPVWDESDDHPGVRQPYGDASWSEGDSRFLVYDRYDIWSVDPEGKETPLNLTKSYGRNSDIKIRYINTHGKERRYLKKGDLMTLSLFNYKDKRNGLASMKYGTPSNPEHVLLDTLSFTQIHQALDAPSFSFIEANFSVMPNVWLAPKGDFPKAFQASDSNPQVKDYNWGTARLVRWNAYDGTPSEGVLYVPENLDPTKKYPMLCVFYETGSEDLYRHYIMEPSWSWVNYPFYVSRGYVVFVPDIHYKAGLPGECAWNFVCSGAEAMCDAYPWIDRERIGIDGQSWGGYQTAYLVTRTNMFACAGSGAPVSNMTSAFGGIRWESGDSRQGQYEQGQSRIGRNLWEAPELYIANSPLFHANRVETPLLIMHNDADGAVPWYQGIELFMALRRLGKPVWMLQYNDEAHNLKERRNRKDITVRLQQFFDHYLKGDPMPQWMKSGIPMTRKGQELGY